MKMHLALIALLLGAMSGACLAADEEEQIDEDELLEFMHDSLRTCSGVMKVTRSGSDFRVVDHTNLRQEFSLKDVFAPKGSSGDMLQLKCGPPGCVAQYIGLAGQWKEAPPANSSFFRCDADLVRRMKVVMRYYRKHYSD